MDLIEKLNPENFKKYLNSTGNTICGRHPISVLLNVSDQFWGNLPNMIEFLDRFVFYLDCGVIEGNARM